MSEVKVEVGEEGGRLACVRSDSVVSVRSSITTDSLSPRAATHQPARRMSHRGPGAASKKCELLQEKPILPNRKVGSKLKAMLSEKEEELKGREPRTKKPSRWEAVMNKIEEGKQTVKPAPRRKRVRSKIFTNLLTTNTTSTTISSTPTPAESLPLQATSR